MVDLTNIETQLTTRIAALDGSQSLEDLLVLKKACDLTSVDTSALDSRIQTAVDAITGANPDEDLLIGNRAAQAVSKVAPTDGGLLLPSVNLPDVYGEARTVGERGWVGKNILDGSDAFVPRLNRGKIHKIGDNLKWAGGVRDANNTGSGTTVVGTQDGNVLVVGTVPSNQWGGGASNTDIVVYTVNPTTGAILHTYTLAASNINCTYAPYQYMNIMVEEVSDNYFFGYITCGTASNQSRVYLFGFEYLPGTQECTNEFTQLAMNGLVNALRVNNMTVRATLNTAKDEIVVLVPTSSDVSTARQSCQLYKGTFNDTAGSKGITGSLTAINQQYMIANSNYTDYQVSNGFFELSDGNFILMNGALLLGSTGNPSPTVAGTPINVLSPTDGSIVASHTIPSDGSTHNTSTDEYYGHIIVHARELEADKYLILTVSVAGIPNNYSYHIVDYNPTGSVITVTNKGTIPTDILQGVAAGHTVMGGAGKTKECRYDSTNKRLIVIGSRCINILNFDNSYDLDVSTSGSYPTRIFDIVNPEAGVDTDYILNNDYSDNVLMKDNQTFVRIFSTSDRIASVNDNDGNKQNYLTTVDILQAGSWGYPLTVHTANTTGSNVTSYGLANGAVNLSGGIPQTQFEDITVITPSLGYLGKVKKSSWESTVSTVINVARSIPHTSSDWKFGTYTGEDIKQSTTSNTNLTASLQPSLNHGLIVSDDSKYITTGLTISRNNTGTPYTVVFGIVVDGFLVEATVGVTLVSLTNRTNRLLYAMAINNASNLDVIMGAESNAATLALYDKD